MLIDHNCFWCWTHCTTHNREAGFTTTNPGWPAQRRICDLGYVYICIWLPTCVCIYIYIHTCAWERLVLNDDQYRHLWKKCWSMMLKNRFVDYDCDGPFICLTMGAQTHPHPHPREALGTKPAALLIWFSSSAGRSQGRFWGLMVEVSNVSSGNLIDGW